MLLEELEWEDYWTGHDKEAQYGRWYIYYMRSSAPNADEGTYWFLDTSCTDPDKVRYKNLPPLEAQAVFFALQEEFTGTIPSKDLTVTEED